jgi:hydrogenase nickel incorporation protein HypB
LGHHANVALLSVTEGDDKPAKYPVMFRAADLVLLSKSDFLDVIDDFDPARAERHVRELANPAPVQALSVRRPDSLQAWFDWLRAAVEARRSGTAMAPRIQPDGAALHAG